MEPKIFGWQHIIILSVSVVLMISSILVILRFAKNPKTLDLIIKAVAAALLIAIVTNRLSIVFKYDEPEWEMLIPNSFCGMSSLVLSLAVLLGKKNNDVLHFVWFIALLGGTLTMFYPDFIGQNPSVFYLPTISGILHHTIAAYLVILLLIFGYVTPTYKKWYCTVFGFTCYLSVGAFLLSVFGLDDAFYIIKPVLSGTPLRVWLLTPIYAVVYGGILAVIEFIRIKRRKKEETAC